MSSRMFLDRCRAWVQYRYRPRQAAFTSRGTFTSAERAFPMGVVYCMLCGFAIGGLNPQSHSVDLVAGITGAIMGFVADAVLSLVWWRIFVLRQELGAEREIDEVLRTMRKAICDTESLRLVSTNQSQKVRSLLQVASEELDSIPPIEDGIAAWRTEAVMVANLSLVYWCLAEALQRVKAASDPH